MATCHEEVSYPNFRIDSKPIPHAVRGPSRVIHSSDVTKANMLSIDSANRLYFLLKIGEKQD